MLKWRRLTLLGNGQVRKTIKVEIKNAEDLQNLVKAIGGNVQVMNKSVVNQPKIQVKKVSPEDRPMESNNGKQLWAKSYLNRALRS